MFVIGPTKPPEDELVARIAGVGVPIRVGAGALVYVAENFARNASMSATIA